MKMTPAERNRVRQLRVLLDEYERSPQPSTAAAIARDVAALITAAVEGDEMRRAEQERRALEVLAKHDLT